MTLYERPRDQIHMRTPMAEKRWIPETLFDESNTPTNEMVVVKAVSWLEYRRSIAAFLPRIFSLIRSGMSLLSRQRVT